MEAFKLAFETIIIGLFALPWLWVMVDLVNPDLFHSAGKSHVIALIPDQLKAPVVGLTLFSVVYLLGSMVTPVACEFLNDRDMLGRWLPTEERIQTWAWDGVFGKTAREENKDVKLLVVDLLTTQPKLSRKDAEEVVSKDWVHRKFQQQEAALLLRGAEACERINRLHEQLTVLRGATFSAFALMVVCGFAWCGRCKKNSEGLPVPLWRQKRRCGSLALAILTIAIAAFQLVRDLVLGPEEGEMPIAELVLLIIGGFGLYVAIHGTRSQFHFHTLAFLFALCFTTLCYAGYGCVENAYDQAVFNAYRAIPENAAAENSHVAVRPAMTMAAALTE